MKKNIALVIAVLIVIIGISLLYYYKVFLPKHNKEKLFSFQNFDTTLTEDIVDNFKRQFDEAVKFIAENPNDYIGWTVAGNMKKSANDYYGARDLYLEGLKNVKPENTDVLLSNLADLNYHFINDYKKAEEYYLRSIEAKPSNIQNYIELSTMYRVRLQNKDMAINIVKVGLENNLDNKELLVQLANTYKKYDMNDEVRSTWQKLIELYPTEESFKKELVNIK